MPSETVFDIDDKYKNVELSPSQYTLEEHSIETISRISKSNLESRNIQKWEHKMIQ